MKRIKIIAVVCVLLSAMMLLSSCNLIDELKEQRFEWKDSDVFSDTIVYKGEEYKRIENKLGRHIRYEPEVQGYVVEEDVPLLLIDTLGSTCHYDEDIDMIMQDGYFFPEDKFEYYSNLVENAALNRYMIDYEYYDYEEQESVNVFYLFSEKETELVDGTIDTVIKKEVEDVSDVYGYERINLFNCDETGRVYRSTVFEIYRDRYAGVCGILEFDQDTGAYFIYDVPANHQKTINKIFDKYYKNSSMEYTEEYSF